jgi:hypothetical protein
LAPFQIGKLVQRFWSNDLRAIDLKTKANNLFQQGQLKKAIQVYTEALELGEFSTCSCCVIGEFSTCLSRVRIA